MGSNTSLREKLIGEELGGCRIEAPIAGGSMGFVFQARHLALDKPVAVKVLTPELRNYKGLRERFRTEARIASAIEHPGVVAIYGVGDEKGYSYIVMRFYDGPSLYRVLSRQGIDPLLAAKIGEHMASALGAIHRVGFVHRDIKPENIILTDKGQAVLTDFGVASEIGVAEPPGRGGSPAYMSPEQCRGDPIDGRSDIYSLGVTLYQLLTGRRPFLGETRPSLLLMHQQDDFPPILSLRPDTLPLFALSVERMLEKMPARRFQRAEDVMEALGKVQDDLRALRRRSGIVIQKKSQGPADSGFHALVSERDTEDVQLDEVAEDVELSLLSLDADEEAATAGQSSVNRREGSQRTAKVAREAMSKSRFDASMARINRAIELRDDDPNLLITRANIHRRMKSHQHAEQDYRHAIELAPDHARALTTLGTHLVTVGRVKEAEELLKRSLTLDMNNVEARVALGKIYEKAAAVNLARKQYEKCVESVPVDERGYVALAALLIGQKQYDEASDALETARELNPTFAPTLFWLAAIAANERNWSAAIELLEASVKAGLKDRKRITEFSDFEPLREHPRYMSLLNMFS